MLQDHHRPFWLVLAVFFLSACSSAPPSSRKWFEADVLFDLDHSKAKELVSKCEAKDYVGNGNLVFVSGKCGANLKTYVEPIKPDPGAIKMYCGTWFPEQPPVLRGAIRNYYLSDRQIEAISDVTITILEYESGFQCLEVNGKAARFK